MIKVSNYPNERENYIYLSAMKVIATILVVYVHSENLFGYADFTGASSLRRTVSVINAVAVPIFFLISGYLLFNKPFEYRSNLKKKVHSLFIPFFIWNTFWFLFELIGSFILPAYFDSFSYDNLLDILIFYFGTPLGRIMPAYKPLWFVRDLFVLNILAGILKKIYNYVHPLLIASALFVLWFSPINILTRQSICFFILGGLIGTHKIKLEFNKLVVPATVCMILGLLIPLCSDNEYLSRLSVLMCTASIFILTYNMPKLQQSLYKIMPFSFPIYVMHGKLLSVIQIILVTLLPQTHFVILMEYLFIPPVVIGLCIVASIIFKKLLPKLFCISIGNRYIANKHTQ